MKGIYLGAYKANHPNYDIVYQDINGKRDLDGDMMDVDLEKYDFIICTPPCNYWSRANYRRETSAYAQQTKHLLPEMLKKLCKIDKPWIVENVKNKKRFGEMGFFNLPCYVYFVGRHTYWSNILMSVDDIPQIQDFVQHGVYIGNKFSEKGNSREGGWNVHQVIERFLETIH